MSLDCFVPRKDAWTSRHCEVRSNPEIKNITSYLFLCQNTEYRIQNTEYRIQNTEYRIQNTEY
jgi:hypothetical protein